MIHSNLTVAASFIRTGNHAMARTYLWTALQLARAVPNNRVQRAYIMQAIVACG